jgi:hypothetical protein
MGADGKLHRDILDAYWKLGFYVFEGVVGAEELAELRADIERMLDHAPASPESEYDARGRPGVRSRVHAPARIDLRNR